MYLTHFGLQQLPFSITPDTEFVFAGNAHQEAFNTLQIAAQSGEGFTKITGEVGTGKTLLCRRFLASLGESYVTAYLPNAMLDPRTMWMALAEELGLIPERYPQPFYLMRALNHALLDFARRGKRVVLCIDDAQAMSLQTLESLRLLSNLETEKSKLLQLVLFGQPELDHKLQSPAVRQLRQRMGFQHRLHGLQHDELRVYLNHRLRVAGHCGGVLFTSPAVRLMHWASRGTPRVINMLAHKSMLSAFGQGKPQVGLKDVAMAVHDTDGARFL